MKDVLYRRRRGLVLGALKRVAAQSKLTLLIPLGHAHALPSR